MPTEGDPVADVRFFVLGPVRVTVDGQEVPIGSANARALLALLLVESNRVVPLDRIADALWSEEKPASWRGTVHVYVARVRTVLTSTGVKLAAVPGGYQLTVDESLIDIGNARSLLADARREERPHERALLLHQALALWPAPVRALVDHRGVTPALVELHDALATELAIARARARARDRGGPAGQHLLPGAVEAFAHGDMSIRARLRAAAHIAGCPSCAAAVEAAADARDATTSPWPGSGTDTLVRTGALSVSIYLGDGAGHAAVEEAVERALALAGVPVVERDEPVLGSWFRRLRASPAAREAAMTAAHAAETRLVHERDAQVTATLLEHIGPVITALHQEKEAVVRLGAVLIVKVNDQLMVHQLTPAQQFRLDHQPHVVAPCDILATLGLPAATNGHHPSAGVPELEQ